MIGGLGAANILRLDAAANEVIKESFITLELKKSVNDRVAVELLYDVLGVPLLPNLTGEVLDALH
jgi:hypothetical protein